MTLNCDTGPGSFVNIKITLKDKEVTTGFLSVMSSFSYLLLQAAKTLETYVGLTQDSAPSFRSCHLLPLSPGSFCAMGLQCGSLDASCGDALQQWVWRDLSSQPRAGCTDSAGLCSSCASPDPRSAVKNTKHQPRHSSSKSHSFWGLLGLSFCFLQSWVPFC